MAQGNTRKEKRYFLPKSFDAQDFYNFLLENKTITLHKVGTFKIILRKPYQAKFPSKGGITLSFKQGVQLKFLPTRQLKLKLKAYAHNQMETGK